MASPSKEELKGMFRGADIKYCGVVRTADDLDTEHAEVGGLFYVEDSKAGAIFMPDGWHRVQTVQLPDGLVIPITDASLLELMYDVQSLNDDLARERDEEIPFTDFDDIIEESDELP